MIARVIPLQEARAAKERAKKMFRQFGKVNGIGITKQGDSYAVQVNFEETPGKGTPLPQDIDGVPVVVHVIGRIRKQLSQ
jgi:hypothetical protein